MAFVARQRKNVMLRWYCLPKILPIEIKNMKKYQKSHNL